jgi:Holliday junction resolvase RusA-like endonuclease
MNDKLEFKSNPIPKPRMTRADAWKKRPCVLSYWDFKDAIVSCAEKQDFKLGEAYKVYFNIEMPKSWSEKKKKSMDGQPHKQRPDIDNLIKAIQDTLLEEDSAVFYVVAVKKWKRKGSIVIENFPENLDF